MKKMDVKEKYLEIFKIGIKDFVEQSTKPIAKTECSSICPASREGLCCQCYECLTPAYIPCEHCYKDWYVKKLPIF